MKYMDRTGAIQGSDDIQDRFLKGLYSNVIGRFFISLLIRPCVSKVGGRLLSTKLSGKIVPSFCKSNHIDLSIYDKQEFDSYNDFFTRKLLEDKQEIDYNPTHLVSPCYSKLSVYPIAKNMSFKVKNTRYTLARLLRSKKLASKYEGGVVCIFRLTVDDYHRYMYIDDGYQTQERKIKGVFHTVNPVANDVYPIYKENTRAYSILQSKNFGNVIMMEVGALLVGKIRNHHCCCNVKRGEEKGYFEYGGSSIILIFQKDKIKIDKDIWNNSINGIETKIGMGEKIGEKFTINS